MEAIEQWLTQMTDTYLDMGYVVIFTPILIIVLGIILGLNKKIVVYRNYSDIAIVCLTVLVPISGFFVLLKMGVTEEGVDYFKTPFLVFEAIMLLIILYRTFMDNHNPFKALLAFVTKVPLGVFFIYNFIEFTTTRRGQKQQGPLVFLMVLTPIIIGLVKNKEGLFAPLNRINKISNIKNKINKKSKEEEEQEKKRAALSAIDEFQKNNVQ